MNIVILGRENVGKSSLFNCLIGEQKALTAFEPGTTRDYKIGIVKWRGLFFNLIDTAGINIKDDTKIGIEVRKKIQQAIEMSDGIFFVVDGQVGVMPQDCEILKIIRNTKLPFFFIVNKIDSSKYEHQAFEFQKLGVKEIFPVSAKSGLGIGDLLDKVVEFFNINEKWIVEHKKIHISLIGKPNVGKSSLLNSILGEERAIVTDIPNTTREPNDIEFEYKGHKLVLIDTAGLRRKKQKKTLTALSMKKSLQTINKSDVVVLVLDATENLTVQDLRLAGMVQEQKKGIIIAVNKWDLIPEKDVNTINEFQDYIQSKLPFLKGAPFIFVSAKTGLRVKKILDLALLVFEEMHKFIKPKELERFLKRIVKKQKPRSARGKTKVHIYKIEQIGQAPPWFAVEIGRNQTLHTSYLRFIENQLRDKYGFIGTPLKFSIIKRSKNKKV